MDARISGKISEGKSGSTRAAETPVLPDEEVDVRKLIGECEKNLNPAKKATPTPPTTNARPRQVAASVTTRSKAKGVQQQPLEPGASTVHRQCVEANISPGENPSKYINRLTEAKAMVAKVRYHLSASRNISGLIKKEVLEAAERLLKLVQEAEADIKTPCKLCQKSSANKVVESKRDFAVLASVEREDRIMASIAENNRLLKENGVRMQEMRRLMEDQRENVENVAKATYASTVSGSPPKADVEKRAGENRRKTLHSVVVTSRDEQETGEEVLERLRKAVEAKEGWVRVERVRKAKDRKVIVGCSTREDREKLREKIEKAGQRLVVENMQNRDPLLVLKDVLTMHSDEEVVRALGNQNREVFGGLGDGENRVTIKYRKRTRNPHTGHIVMAVSPTVWARATERGRLRIDLQNVVVEDQSPLVQCSRCLGYGHSRKFCRETADLCSHCGGLHLSADCPERLSGAPPECKNCTRAKYDHCAHNAFSSECPVRGKWDRLARASVAYC